MMAEYANAYLHRVKKFPSLDGFMNPGKLPSKASIVSAVRAAAAARAARPPLKPGRPTAPCARPTWLLLFERGWESSGLSHHSSRVFPVV